MQNEYVEAYAKARRNDPSLLPEWKVVHAVLKEVERAFLIDFENQMGLTSPTPPWLVAACFTKLFGEETMQQVVTRLSTIAEAAYQMLDYGRTSELFRQFEKERELLASTVDLSKDGDTETNDPDRIARLALAILQVKECVDPFVAAIYARLAVAQ
jgi:hypothetical protein